MSKVLDNIYVYRFLLSTFLLNKFYRRSTAIVFGTVFLILSGDCGNFIFSGFFYPITINFHNSEIEGNVLPIGLQYTFSLKWYDFGMKCLLTTMPKG